LDDHHFGFTSQNPFKNPGLKEQTMVFAFLKIKIIHVSKL
jgi:hypothetical protein